MTVVGEEPRRAYDRVALSSYFDGVSGADLDVVADGCYDHPAHTLHLAELERHKGWPVIPMASAYERMSEERAPVGELLVRSAPPVEAVFALWRRLEQALAESASGNEE